jgi:hypothetical protein
LEAVGDTNFPLKRTRFRLASRMKNKNGRSALNSIGSGLLAPGAQPQRSIITSPAAAASVPKQNVHFHYSFLSSVIQPQEISDTLPNYFLTKKNPTHNYSPSSLTLRNVL